MSELKLVDDSTCNSRKLKYCNSKKSMSELKLVDGYTCNSRQLMYKTVKKEYVRIKVSRCLDLQQQKTKVLQQ